MIIQKNSNYQLTRILRYQWIFNSGYNSNMVKSIDDFYNVKT